MKRCIAVLLALLLVACLLTGCGQTGSGQAGSREKISVVCTIFPQYDWVRQILGDQTDTIEVTLLLDDAIDLHNYQPTVDDMIKIADCDLFIYVGGESDRWVDDALSEATNKNLVALNLLEILGDNAREEEIVEGMETEVEGPIGVADSEVAGEVEYDEHIWLSLRNAEVFCTAITDALASLDPSNAGIYRSNLVDYYAQLFFLDGEYAGTIKTAPVKTLLFGDRFPFRYLADDYGINYYAAFAGCSAETEASFETVIFLAKKVDELNLKYIMVTESTDQSIANTIRDNTTTKDQQILVLDSMQTIAAADITQGTTYLSIMASNLDVLKVALG